MPSNEFLYYLKLVPEEVLRTLLTVPMDLLPLYITIRFTIYIICINYLKINDMFLILTLSNFSGRSSSNGNVSASSLVLVTC